MFDDLLRRAFGHNTSTVHPSAWPHVDHVVGHADGVFVMLDHNDGIAQVAQMFQRIQQAIIVALMQANGRFIQHVHNAGQAGTNLRGQTNPLGFTARKRIG